MQGGIFKSPNYSLAFSTGQTAPIPSCSNCNSFQAIRCSFANYDPKEKGWNEDAARFSSQLIGKYCSVTVVDILQEEMMLSFAVEVVIPDSGE